MSPSTSIMMNIAVLSVVLSLFVSGHCRSILHSNVLQLPSPEIVSQVGPAGVTGAHAAAAAADNLALIMDDSNLWDDVDGAPECCVSCNGKNVTASEDNGKGVYSCWGQFKAFCKGKGEKVFGVAGFKCQGHFVGIKTEGGARVAVCEGDKKAFGAKFIKAGGKKIKAFKAGGCLGTSSFIGKPYNKSSDAIELAWPADMPQVWDANYAGVELLQNAFAESNGEGPLAQGRCGGFGGGVKVVKVKLAGEDEENDAKHCGEFEEMDFAHLEGVVNKTMDKMGVAMPVPAMPSYFDFAPVFADEENGPSCKVLCNGKPAWFKGQFPCFGKLEVKCKPGIDAPKYAPKFFAASCKGMWSGIFGHRCKGQAAAFVDTKYTDKLNICTGKFGMMAKKSKCSKGAKFVTGAACKGKSLGAFFLDFEEDASKAVALPN